MKQNDILSRSVTEVIDQERLSTRLSSGEKLRIKFGIDPTSPHIHLGRAVPLLKLRDFQRAGHTIVFIIGDFTGTIGDTSDKESERPMLTQETVEANLKTYFEQAGKILDMDLVEKHTNSEWLEKLGYREIGEQADAFSVAEFIARDNIARRLEAGKRVSLREMLYPIMQGYDSVMVRADVEIGGTDQRFNILAGRKLQERFGQSPQSVLLLELLPGIDGRKMSSSWGNTINLLDTPQDMFGKIMRIPDTLIGTYMLHTTRMDADEIRTLLEGVASGEINPRDAKIRLAHEIVRMYHGDEAAAGAEQYFIDTFSRHLMPEDVSEIVVAVGDELMAVLVAHGLAESRTDAKRKIEQGGVEMTGERVTDIHTTIDHKDIDQIIRVGKKEFRRLVLA
jgi:tyrosyl-tRNA synthetase